MKDERCKQLMEQVGLPNSQSLMIALRQVENETEHRLSKLIAEKDALLREAALAMVHSRDNGFVYRDQFDLVINKINEAQAEGST